MMKYQKPENTLLKKVLILFTSIFIPLFILSLGIMNYSNQKLKKQVLSSTNAGTANHISQLETALNTTYINNFNQISQSNFRKFSNTFFELTPYETSMQINLIREQISNLSMVSPFVESAHVYFKNRGIACNSKNFRLGSYHQISPNELKLLEKLTKEPQILQYYLNPLTKKWDLALSLVPTPSADYQALVVLSKEKLESYFTANASYKNEHYLFTVGERFSMSDFSPELKVDALEIQDELFHSFADKPYTTATLKNQDYYVFFYDIPGFGIRYVRFIPTSSLLASINTAPILIIIFFLFIAAACILFFIGIYRTIHKPMQKFIDAFEEVEHGNFKASITDYQTLDFAYLFRAFNNMTEKLDQLVERDYKQKLLLQKAELKQLQAQINPHFLYNSFFMLQRMIKMEMLEEAQEVSNALGVYFRYLTRNSMDQVKLAEEYEHAKKYAYIQGLRFEGRIEIIFDDIPDEFKALPVPKLILQPLLENAFNYGLHNKIKDGLLEIHFSASGETLTITVEENGEELSDETLASLSQKLETVTTGSSGYEMTGIFNIQRRLVIFSDYRDSLHVSRSKLGGLCISITLKNNFTEVS